jgi:ubiquinone/menaquinone biosynthesis C-methylase UbiE
MGELKLKSLLNQPILRSAMQYPVFGYNFARFLHYRSQNFFLNLIVRAIPGVDKDLIKAGSQPTSKIGQLLVGDLTDLLLSDAKNIADGVYPLSVLIPEMPGRHLFRIPKLFIDGLRIYKRRKSKKHSSFSNEAKNYLDEVPEYYRRNYHFQTDGYLSEHSAELYDHQVELLFSGAADAMRRILLKPLKQKVGSGDKLKFLEVACGTGRMSRFMRLTFPNAKIVATDVSNPYLKVARKKLEDLTRVDFLQADAAQLPFLDESFDVFYSVFLFHEQPPAEREAVIKEAHRVLKPGGIFCFVDSVQIKDFEEAKDALTQFPVDFHEPFYKNYIENPMEDLLGKNGFKFCETHRGFLSKAVLAQK